MIEVIALGGRTSFCEFPLWVDAVDKVGDATGLAP